MDVPADVVAFLEGRPEPAREIIIRLRALVLDAIPGLFEQVDGPADMLAYGFAKTYKDMVCVIMPQKGYVNFGFPRGADLDDPQGLLEGTGKKARHVKVRTVDAVGLPGLGALLAQSAALARK